jgi:MarR family transcriptional regulator, organic hydroperoxide resistance regulator
MLESQRLIERRPAPPIARAKQLVLAPDGTELRERLLKLLNEESPMAGLARQEQGVLQGLLQRAISRR